MRWIALAALAAMLNPAFQERIDVAGRFRDFELAYEAKRGSLDVATRAAVNRHLTEAVAGTFAGAYGAVIESVARAKALVDGVPWDDKARARELWYLAVHPRIVEAGAKARVVVRVSPIGPHPADPPEVVYAVGSRRETRKLGESAVFDLSADGPGRQEVTATVAGVAITARAEAWVVKDLGTRLAALRKALPELPADDVAASLLWRLSILEDASKGEPLEVVPDAVAELDLLEADARERAAGRDPHARRTGDLRRAWAMGKTSWPSRVHVPSTYDPAKPAGLVVALHGHGGSENFYFEILGAGKIKRLAEERGWIVVAPRTPAMLGDGKEGEHLAELVRRVSAAYAVDPARVFLTGHSRGGGQALAAAEFPGAPWKAVAAIAPAGSASPERLKAPLYLACGDQDLLVLASRKIAKSFEGRPGFRYDERKGLEHVLIVTETLADAFAFFASAGK